MRTELPLGIRRKSGEKDNFGVRCLADAGNHLLQ
jgi:hypothetical protein